MSELLQSSDSCVSEYIYWPISDYRKKLFTSVINKIDGGNVLDLGCGQAGVYWSMGYAERVDSIILADYSQENIEAANKQLNDISPVEITEKFGSTFEFLQETGIVSSQSDATTVAGVILDKVVSVEKVDFLNMEFQTKFDYILSIEAIECINNYEELIIVLNNCRKALVPGGRLLGVVLRYNKLLESTREMTQRHEEGLLNPDAETLKRGFIESGFSISSINTVPTPELFNYSQALIYDVART